MPAALLPVMYCVGLLMPAPCASSTRSWVARPPSPVCLRACGSHPMGPHSCWETHSRRLAAACSTPLTTQVMKRMWLYGVKRKVEWIQPAHRVAAAGATAVARIKFFADYLHCVLFTSHTDKEAAFWAKKNRAYAVITDDTDFLCYEGVDRIWSANIKLPSSESSGQAVVLRRRSHAFVCTASVGSWTLIQLYLGTSRMYQQQFHAFCSANAEHACAVHHSIPDVACAALVAVQTVLCPTGRQ